MRCYGADKNVALQIKIWVLQNFTICCMKLNTYSVIMDNSWNGHDRVCLVAGNCQGQNPPQPRKCRKPALKLDIYGQMGYVYN